MNFHNTSRGTHIFRRQASDAHVAPGHHHILKMSDILYIRFFYKKKDYELFIVNIMFKFHKAALIHVQYRVA